MMRVNRSAKTAVQSVTCFFLKNGRNQSSANVKVLKAPTGTAGLSNNMWTVPRVPVLSSVPDAGAGVGGAAAVPKQHVKLVLQPSQEIPSPPESPAPSRRRRMPLSQESPAKLPRPATRDHTDNAVSFAADVSWLSCPFAGFRRLVFDRCFVTSLAGAFLLATTLECGAIIDFDPRRAVSTLHCAVDSITQSFESRHTRLFTINLL